MVADEAFVGVVAGGASGVVRGLFVSGGSDEEVVAGRV